MLKRILFTICLVLWASPAFSDGGSSPKIQEILNVTAQTASVNSSSYCYNSRYGGFAFSLEATYNSGTPTLDVKMQTSIDGGTTWVDLDQFDFTQVTTADSDQILHLGVDRVVLGCVRAVATLAGTAPNYDFIVRVHYGKRG